MTEQSKKTILILSAPIGSGHTRAAEAIGAQLAKRPDINVVMGDIFDFVPNFFCKSLLKIYFFLLNNIPASYDYLYRWGDTSGSLFLRFLVNRLFSIKGAGLLAQVQPDAVIATHVTPAGLIALHKRKTQDKLLLFGIVTDYSMHKWWLYDEINAYSVFDKKIFADYLAQLKNGQQLWELGIPVHDEFRPATVEKKNMLREKYDLPQKAFICLLSGGGEGLLPMQKIIQAWQEKYGQADGIYFVAVCGKNKQLEHSLSAMALPYVRVLSYTDDVCDYMKAADLLISKAGGVTITEAVSVNLPIILYKPLPGQEYVNTKYLLEQKLAVLADSLNELTGLVAQAAKDKKFFEHVKERQKALTKPKSAENISREICRFWQ